MDDVAGSCFVNVDTVQAVTHQLQDTTVTRLPSASCSQLGVRLDATTGDSTNADNTQEAVVVQRRFASGTDHHGQLWEPVRGQ
jgi:hypothetical protein